MTTPATSTQIPTEAPRSAAGYDLIAFAASAGGVSVLRRILAALPATVQVPIAIVLHRTTREPQMLPQILSRVTSRHVKAAEPGEPLRPNTVYVAPPDYHLIVRPDHTLEFTDGRRIKFVLSSANPLLASAARVLKNRVIAVVLTGTGSDATDGVQAVKELGGIVIAQTPEEAEYSGMPTSAIRTGVVDYIVPIDEIAALLARLTGAPRETSVPEPR